MSFVIVPKPQRSPVPFQILAVLIGSLVLFFLATSAVTIGFQLAYVDRIFPGVSVAGVDLSNKTAKDASLALGQRLNYPADGRIVFNDGDRVWVANPVELGMVIDIGASVQRAFGVGRAGGQLGRLTGQVHARVGGVNIPPVILLDKRVAYIYLQKLAGQIDRPDVEADLHLDGTQVSYTSGQIGRRLNVDKTLNALVAQLESFRDGEVSLVVEDQPPLILDASAQAGILRQILSTPLTLAIPNAQADDPAPWTIDPGQLASMLIVQRSLNAASWQYQISVITGPIQQYLDQIGEQVDRSPQNARFTFNDTTRQLDLIQPSVSGRILDEAATQKAIQDGLLRGEHNIPLSLTIAPPQVGDDATSASLGITELVSERSLYFRGSSSDRVQNIATASARFHGLLVPPNSVFSMADALGDISLDNGYAEAPIIFNGQSILGVGGGVCQVSTTLFQTIFYGGYPIVERTPHAYRVRYYEENATGYDPNLVGLDATVFVPLVDLKFKNDRSSWLLMEVYVNTNIDRITWKFYSAGAPKVLVAPPVITNVVPPPTEWQFEENPSLSPGEIVEYQSAAEGETVIVNRTVSKADGTMLFADAVQTVYAPRQAVCQFGPGTHNPEKIAKDAGLCQP
jgi:vancomycin resistance protein YoaR